MIKLLFVRKYLDQFSANIIRNRDDREELFRMLVKVFKMKSKWKRKVRKRGLTPAIRHKHLLREN